MRSLPTSWNTTLTKLGLRRRSRGGGRGAGQSASRGLRLETLEDRRVMAADIELPVLEYNVHSESDWSLVETARVTDSYTPGSPAVVPEGAQVDHQPLITTTGNPAGYVTGTGTALDGVAELSLTIPGVGVATCSGTLLPTGRHILTAAHCFTDTAGNPIVSSLSADFTLPGGTQTLVGASVALHPGFNGLTQQGSDIAIVTLATSASADVPRLDIYRGASEFTVPDFAKTGYGRSGTGATGDTLAAGTKRYGLNNFDADGNLFNGTVLSTGVVSLSGGTSLVYDFDNGLAANDASGTLLGVTDLGLGSDEVSVAPGDSGGPALIDGQVAGITSWGLSISGPDALAGLNSSFGEFAFDTRVSAFASWVDSVVDIVGPQVTGVSIGGPNTLDGNRGPTDGFYDIPSGSGEQIRTVPVGGADLIEITFSEAIDTSTLTGALSLTGAFTSNDYTASLGAPTWDALSNTATWEYTPAIADDQLPIDQLVLLLDDAVTDTSGVRLDGEWTNPVTLTATGTSVFPSGNGSAEGDFEFYFTSLPADFDTDNTVTTATDGFIFVANQGVGNRFTQGDANGDGSIDTAGDGFILVAALDFDFTSWPAPSAPLMGGGGSSSALAASDAAFAALAYSLESLDEDQDTVDLLAAAMAA